MAPTLMINRSAELAKAASLTSRAYVTFLAGNGDYVKGVVGLAKGLRKVNTAYPLVVAVLPDVPEEHRRILVAQGCIVREIEPVYPPENQTQFAMAYYVINYSKLRIWEFVEYHKMIYLDGDIQVYENIDHLFDMPDGFFYAVMDCFCEKTWSHTPQYKIGYCQQCPNRVHWPTEMGPKPPLYFNAGMFVYEPSLSVYDDLLRTLKVTPPTPFAEQDFLNMFFRDIYKPIPPIYNLVLAMLRRHPENIELEKVKVVHYCAAGKHGVSKGPKYPPQQQGYSCPYLPPPQQGPWYPPPQQQGPWYPPLQQQGPRYSPLQQQVPWYPPLQQQGPWYPPPSQQGPWYPPQQLGVYRYPPQPGFGASLANMASQVAMNVASHYVVSELGLD